MSNCYQKDDFKPIVSHSNYADVNSLFNRVGTRLGWFNSDIQKTLEKLTTDSEKKKKLKTKVQQFNSPSENQSTIKETNGNEKKKYEKNTQIIDGEKINSNSKKKNVDSDTPNSLVKDQICRTLCFSENQSPDQIDCPLENTSSKQDLEVNLQDKNGTQIITGSLCDTELPDLSISFDEHQQQSCLKEKCSPALLINSSKFNEAHYLPFSSESSEDDDFEKFLHKVKTPHQASSANKNSAFRQYSDDVFINDCESSSSDDDGFYLRYNFPANESKISYKSPSQFSDRVFSSSVTPWKGSHLVVRQRDGILNSLDSHFSLTSTNKKKDIAFNSSIIDINSQDYEFVTPASKKKLHKRPLTEIKNSVSTRETCNDFMSSLSPHTALENCHSDALPYRKDFKKMKNLLVAHLFKIYNEKIFNNKLPSDFQITWNVRMTKSAGYCYYRYDSSKTPSRVARIELSEKVCDSCDRVRDTLIHELCHAAAWIVSGYKDGHGSLWKAWASKVNSVFLNIPLVSRCHSYNIHAKYIYRCSQCSTEVKRHSKSLDTNRKICGHCKGTFELFVNGQKSERKPLNKFASYVKENYKDVKGSIEGLSHQAIMQILSTDFAKKTSLS